MVDSKQDLLAKDVVELSISFKMALSNKRKYPMVEFKSFLPLPSVTSKRLEKTHSFIARSSVRSADFGNSSRLNASACQEKFYTKLIDWNVSFFLAMTHTSRKTSRRVFSVKPIFPKPHLRSAD